MTQTCTYCTSEVKDTVVCPRCTRVTSANLADMGEWFAELTTVMVKDTQYAEKSDGGKSVDPTIAWGKMGDQYLDQVSDEIERNPIATPYAKAAAACLHDLRSTLVSWSRLLHEERGIGLPRNTVPFMADHLRRNMNIIASHEAAGEFVAEMTNLVKRIIVVIDAPANRSKFAVGPCPERLETGACPGTVVAIIPADEQVRPTMRCGHCKFEWHAEQWSSVGERILKLKAAA
jgi:hypothetical protein